MIIILKKFYRKNHRAGCCLCNCKFMGICFLWVWCWIFCYLWVSFKKYNFFIFSKKYYYFIDILFSRNAVRKLEGPLKNRCIGIWLAISYFFISFIIFKKSKSFRCNPIFIIIFWLYFYISWFPHASVHQFLTPLKTTDFIILEIAFHWPTMMAAFVVCYFQFDLIKVNNNNYYLKIIFLSIKWIYINFK